MTQLEYEIIYETLKAGVPALADKLINAVVKVLTENSELKVRLEELNKKEAEKGKEPAEKGD